MPRTYTEQEVMTIIGLTKEYERVCISYAQQNGIHRRGLGAVDELIRRMEPYSSVFSKGEINYLKEIKGSLEKVIQIGAVF